MDLLRIGTWLFDPDRRELRRGDEVCRLTELERDLLAYLLRRAEPVSAERLLRDVWGYAPSVQSRAVIHTVRRLRKKLDDEAERLVNVYGQGYRLDVPDLGSLLGRRAVLAEVQRLLSSQGVVTLFGLGGVGKTSLARTLAATGDVVWVHAPSFSDEIGFLASIARTMGGGAARVTLSTVGRMLREASPDLLVVDSAEGILSDLLSWLTELRTLAPIPVLVTSRTSGGPAPVRLDPLARDDAARLFVRLVREQRGEDSLDPALVDRLVRAVSGIPLAIELAAARLRFLGLAELVTDLERDVAALGQREGSVEALLETTWASLEEDEQRLLATVAWMRRPADVEMLVAASALPKWTLLDALDGLVRASLVLDEARRFSVLDVISRFVADRVSDTAVFLAWATARARRLLSEMREDVSWTAEPLLVEVPTLRQALARAVEPEQRAMLALAVFTHDMLYGRLEPVRSLLEQFELGELTPELAVEVLLARTRAALHAPGPERPLALARQALDRALAEGTSVQRVVAWNQYVFVRMVAEGPDAAAQDVVHLLNAAGRTIDDAEPATPGESLGGERVPWPVARQAFIISSDVAVRRHALDDALSLVERAATDVVVDSPVGIHVLARRSALLQLLGTEDLGIADAGRAYEAARALQLPALMLVAGQELLLAALAAGRDELASAKLPEIVAVVNEVNPVRLATTALVEGCIASNESDARDKLRQAAEVAGRGHMIRVQSVALRELAYRIHLQEGPEAARSHYVAARDAVADTGWHQERQIAATWLALGELESGELESTRLSELEVLSGLAGAVVKVARRVVSGDDDEERSTARVLEQTAMLGRRIGAIGE